MKVKKKKSWRTRFQEFFEIPAKTLLKILLLLLIGLQVQDYLSSSAYIYKESVRSIVIVSCSDPVTKLGSISAGFVSSKYGHIVTAAHGVESCYSSGHIEVIYFSDGWVRRRASIQKYNRSIDVAVLQVPKYLKNVRPLVINTDMEYVPGSKTVTIGHPHRYYWSVSAGIISADRYWVNPYKRVIQSSTPISPGNSGGPLFNEAGEVIGIVSYSSGGVSTLGFIVPGEIIQAMINGI